MNRTTHSSCKQHPLLTYPCFLPAAVLATPAVSVSESAVLAACGGDAAAAEAVRLYLSVRDMAGLKAEGERSGGSVTVRVDGKSVTVREGREYFFGAAAAAKAASS